MSITYREFGNATDLVNIELKNIKVIYNEDTYDYEIALEDKKIKFHTYSITNELHRNYKINFELSLAIEYYNLLIDEGYYHELFTNGHNNTWSY